MAEHLPDDEQRLLGDRLRGPQVGGDLERAGAAGAERLDDAVAAALVVGQPLADELGVVGDRRRRGRCSRRRERHRGGPPQALEVLDARARARAGRARAPGRSRCSRRSWRAGGRRRTRSARARRRAARRSCCGPGAPRRAGRGRRRGCARRRRARRRRRRRRDSRRMKLPEVLVVGDHRAPARRGGASARARSAGRPRRARRSARRRRPRARGRDPGARARGDRRREPAVVEVVVRDQHQLEVLEPHAGARAGRPRARPAPRRRTGRCRSASAGRPAAARR